MSYNKFKNCHSLRSFGRAKSARKNFSTYNKDGTWNLRIELVSNDVNYNFTESGTFSCHGNNLITYVREVDGEKLNDNSLFHEYLINEITEKKFIFEAINVKCENVESDCDNTKYEVYKNEK